MTLLTQSFYNHLMHGIVAPFLRHHVFVKTASTGTTAAACLGVLAAGVLSFLVLARTPRKQRKQMIVIITFLAGFYWSLEFLIPSLGTGARADNFLTTTQPPFNMFTRVMGAWTVGLGLINIVMIHGGNVFRLKKGWYNSIALFLAMAAMTMMTVWRSLPHRSQEAQQVFDILYYGVYSALKQGMWAVLAFYISSAAYRAFRVKSGEATLMMITAVLVMLGQVPMTIAITSHIPPHSWWAWARLENINTWLQLSPGMAARRAILLGAAVGGLAISLRVWLSLERGAYFDQEM